jgi:aminoglycoside phosphotransferase (APT) family kinase protein
MDDLETRLRAYVSAAIAAAPSAVESIERCRSGERHRVFRASCRVTETSSRDVIVRLSLTSDTNDRRSAEREAAVLERIGGVGAPALYDFRVESEWFDAPVMCLQFIDGRERDLAEDQRVDLERLGQVVAAVHRVRADDLARDLGGVTSLADYVNERLKVIAAYLPRLGPELPVKIRSRVDGAFVAVTGMAEWESWAAMTDDRERLVLLHGDVAGGNILWSPEPVLIDWEYARIGDPADEVAYVFGQHSLARHQREAFLDGYVRAAGHHRPEDLVKRARLWEPVLLLGSALWWLERACRRVRADRAGTTDPAAPKKPDHYLQRATWRLDRFDVARMAARRER